MYRFLMDHFHLRVSADAASRGAVLIVHSRLETESLPGEPLELRKGERPGERPIYLHLFNRTGQGVEGFHYDPLFQKVGRSDPPVGPPSQQDDDEENWL